MLIIDFDWLIISSTGIFPDLPSKNRLLICKTYVAKLKYDLGTKSYFLMSGIKYNLKIKVICDEFH